MEMSTMWLVLHKQFYTTFVSASLFCFWCDAISSLLKQRLTETCATHHIINEAVDKWRKRLRFCVSAEDGHFAHSWRCC